MKKILFIIFLLIGVSYAQERNAATTGEFIGYKNIFIPANALDITVVSGSINVPGRDSVYGFFTFDSSTAETAGVFFVMPTDFLETDTAWIYVLWSGATAGTGNVYWGFEYQLAQKDSALSSAYEIDTLAAVTASTIRLQYTLVGAVNGENGSTMKALSAVRGKVYRKANDGNDSYNNDARLYGVLVVYQADPKGSWYKLGRTN